MNLKARVWAYMFLFGTMAFAIGGLWPLSPIGLQWPVIFLYGILTFYLGAALTPDKPKKTVVFKDPGAVTMNSSGFREPEQKTMPKVGLRDPQESV